ncbi:DNA-processing protein DprA [Aciduricibacillus chroicocephali]|uniref:DNA-processing protein DprA n=1 Tax=Aciduricibacillus chroicocephali TaxID=3054939 RepID=A0ABY9KY25_9BACI|nr:DNA-processing protein DprA [Bacillaceae bacterium 44XB]
MRLQEQIREEQKRIKILTWFDREYPPLLRLIKDAPLILYVLGRDHLLIQPAISVIGTRNPSAGSSHKTAAIVDPLTKAGFCIVSGLASGIDAQAHERALTVGGKTIAVLGSGFNYIYPRNHLPLSKMIANTGLLLSEYPPDTPPKKYHFPERNRIISGLSFGVVVIEALSRSGTMITVDQALDQGREVYAMPDSLFLPQSAGCHDLIGQGAKLVTCGSDITKDWVDFGARQYEPHLKHFVHTFDKSD